jgi:diguanylate cyclase (GGDEF)-like protein
LSTKALQERKAVLSNNVTIDFPGFTQPEKGMNINSWIGIPLISHGEIIGLMALDHLEKNQFNKHQLELAEIVGDHIATALENSQLHERTYKMAMEDALTGIGSRHRLQMEGRLLFESAIRSESSLSLAILDIDKFKDVNDTFGHDIGDLVLKRIADTCAQEIRITDLLARLGGEEFIILLPDTTEDKAFQIIDRIRTKVGAIHHPEFDKQVAISAGVYGAVPDKENKLGSYQTKADKALYASKSNGRNRVTLFSSL